MNDSPFVRVSTPGVEYLACASFPAPHAFTLRTHGFGERVRGEADRRLLSETLGLTGAAFMRQVHGARVKLARRAGEPDETDGLMTDTAGLGLVVHSADCVPLLFWAEKTNVVAAVHSGWRGTLARIATRAVSELGSKLGAEPEELHVALGPAIRACCFEVGEEVVEAFARTGRDIDRITATAPGGRRHVDLVEDNRLQLRDAGVAEHRIHDSGRCTSCDNGSFYSYRREGTGVGRVMSMVGKL